MPDSTTREPPSELAQDLPPPATNLPADQAADESENPEAPSPAWTDDPSNVDLEITRTGSVEPVRPTVMSKCPAKEELLDQRRVKMDVANYAHMSVGDIFSGYMSQLHSSRNLEIDMVKQMHQKFEV